MVFAVAFLTARFPGSNDVLAMCGIPGLLGFPVVYYLWCKSDSLHRDVQPPPGAIPLGAVLWPLSLVYYVLFTYSFGRASVKLLKIGALAIAVVVVASYAGNWKSLAAS